MPNETTAAGARQMAAVLARMNDRRLVLKPGMRLRNSIANAIPSMLMHHICVRAQDHTTVLPRSQCR